MTKLFTILLFSNSFVSLTPESLMQSRVTVRLNCFVIHLTSTGRGVGSRATSLLPAQKYLGRGESGELDQQNEY